MNVRTKHLTGAAISTVCLSLAIVMASDEGAVYLERFLELRGSNSSTDTRIQRAGELVEYAGNGDREFFDALETEVRRIRRESLPNFDEKKARLDLLLTSETLISAELWSPTLLEFAEESLADPRTRPSFLESLIPQLALRLASEADSPQSYSTVHNYPRERFVAFLVQAAHHPDKKLHDNALMQLTGYRGGRRTGMSPRQVWSVDAALPILRRYATAKNTEFEDRAEYLEWLIALNPPDRDEYVQEYRAYVFDSMDQRKRLTKLDELSDRGGLIQRFHYGERLRSLGFATQEELKPLQDEFESIQQRIRRRSEVMTTNGARSAQSDTEVNANRTPP